MKYLKELQSKKIFTLADIAKLTRNVNTATSLVAAYKKAGYIASVRKNLYVALDIASGNPIASRYEISSQTSESSFISYHSAMEYYGVANQVFFEVIISAKERIRPFTFDGISYRCIQTDYSESVVTPPLNPLIRVASIERAVVDCIQNINLAGGLEELIECIKVIPELNAEELLKVMKKYNQKKLWQFVGFILEQFKEQFRIPDSFFDECKNNIGVRKNYLSDGNNLVYHYEWKLYAPNNLLDITNEGGNVLV